MKTTRMVTFEKCANPSGTILCGSLVFLGLISASCAGRDGSTAKTPPVPQPVTAGSETRTLQSMLHQQRHALEILGLCGAKAQHPELLDFCKQLSADHRQSVQTLQNWLATWYPQAKPLSAAEHAPDEFRNLLAAMQSSTGQRFDEAFLRGMRVHHRQDANEAKACQAQAAHSELKQFCVSESQKADQEISQFSGWICAWFQDCL